MKPETLRAFLMDRELGELRPDVAELLDAYLAAEPSARAECDVVARTIDTTRETVRRFPDLAPAAESETESKVIPIYFWLARAAAVIAVAAFVGWLGYRAGQANRPETKPAVAQSVDPRYDGLWAKYQVAYDARRGTFVVAQQP